MLTTEGRWSAGPLSVLTNASRPPKVTSGSSHAASTMAAFGDAAEDHSTSIAASESSPTPGGVGLPWNPGSVPGRPPEGLTCVSDAPGYAVSRPKGERNPRQSFVE